MAKRDPVAEGLARLSGAPGDPEIEAGLASKHGLVVARAAELAGQRGEERWIPLLCAGFDRLIAAPMTADRGCQGKEQLVRALDQLGAREHARYEAGLRHVQLEPAFGPPVDTAVGLRGVSAIAVVNSRHPEAISLLAVLLADKEPRARASAAHAIGASGRPEGRPLLVYKAETGDPEAEVLVEVLGALIALDEDVGYVARLLDRPDPDLASAAVVALGQSRRPAALEPLCRQVERSPTSADRRDTLLAIAMLRTPEALDRLLRWVAEGPLGLARDAMGAVAIYRHDAALMQRMAELVDRRGEPELSREAAALSAGARGSSPGRS